MRKMNIVDEKSYAYNFVYGDFLPKGKDEYYIRDSQVEKKNTGI